MAEARYDAVAGFYATGFEALDDPASAALLELLGSPARLDVLDAACGHGRLSRELARRGARVTGVDLSGALIARAADAERDHPLGVRYVHADVASAAGLGEAAFDVVTCNWGLSDIDDLDRAAAAISAALRPGGRVVFSILHPCFPGAADTSGSWPTAGRYYDEGRWTAGGALSSLRRQVGANHRMISTYLNAFRQHGLWLDQVREPEPEQQWRRERPLADPFPVYLAASFLKAIRPSARWADEDMPSVAGA
jgi:SAM-dependent methyltransferase